MELDYIIDATNKIHDVLLQSYLPREDDLRRIFAIGCHTLRRVNAQTEVLRDLQRLSDIQNKYLAEYKEICGNLEHFVYGFCRIEKEVMVKAGISNEAAESLLREARSLRQLITNLRIDPSEVQMNILKLNMTVCVIAQGYHYLPIWGEERQKAKQRLKKLAAGMGGIALIGINASALAYTVGLSLAGSAVSGGVGSGLVGASLAIK